ncbi:MAG: hypothetical protein IJE08_00055 [Clostridia bacterium]|nr:hypothetical protein [Clostridia bacterium]
MNDLDPKETGNLYDGEEEEGDGEYVELGGQTTVLPEEEKKNPYNTRKNQMLTLAWLCLLVAALIAADRVGLKLTAAPQEEDERIRVSIEVEADGVYGVCMDYGVNRTIIGSQVCTNAQGMAVPLPAGEIINFDFLRQDFQEGFGPEDGPFFLLPGVILEDGSELPAGDAWEWTAAYGESCSFELTGSRASGFDLTQAAQGKTQKFGSFARAEIIGSEEGAS